MCMKNKINQLKKSLVGVIKTEKVQKMNESSQYRYREEIENTFYNSKQIDLRASMKWMLFLEKITNYKN